MYAAARRGELLERTPARVTIHRIELTSFDPPFAEFSVDCSSGTYIRSIARDAGESLGVGAHLTRLRRTRIGEHDVAHAVRADQMDDPDAVARSLVLPADAVRHLPRMVLAEDGIAALRYGRAVPADATLPEQQPVAMLGPSGELLAVGERIGDRLQPRKVFL
jgi:tRNA pseudouridine55 synthase